MSKRLKRYCHGFGNARFEQWYLLTSKEYARQMRRAKLVEMANGCRPPYDCEVCQQTMRKPQWDHDHSTGMWRGWICLRCNLLLGRYGDDIDRLRQRGEKLLDVACARMGAAPWREQPASQDDTVTLTYAVWDFAQKFQWDCQQDSDLARLFEHAEFLHMLADYLEGSDADPPPLRMGDIDPSDYGSFWDDDIDGIPIDEDE
jgi:hypothetical protein